MNPFSYVKSSKHKRTMLYTMSIVYMVLFSLIWISLSKTGYHMGNGYQFIPWLKRFTLSLGNSDPPLMTGIDDDYDTRLKRVEKFCKERNRTSTGCRHGDPVCSLHFLVVDENNKAMFFSIPKVASTILRLKLAALTGKKLRIPVNSKKHRIPVHSKAITKYKIFEMPTYSKKKRAYRMRKYFKFVFVRHPLTRLLSAYRDKIEFGTNPYGKPMLPLIIRYLRHNKTDKSSISFQEFASYILRKKGRWVKNPHWNRYNRLCRFCEVQYDFIGRQELLEKDSNYLLQKLFHKSDYGDFNNSFHRTFTDLSLAKKYYSQLTEKTKQGLLQLYGEDMEMFGYKSSDIF